MAGKTNRQKFIKKVWEDMWKWLLGTKMGWVVAVLIGGIIGGILAGFIGVIVAIVLTVVIAFIYYLIVTPSNTKKETRHKFIRDNASYFSRIFGNREKRRGLAILEILKAMIIMENEATDSIAGKLKAIPFEINQIKKRLNEQTKVPLIPDSKALKIFLSGKADKKIKQTINKLKLNIMGEKPTEYQIQFFIKIRAILDETGFGMAGRLPSEYTEYSRKFEELIRNDDDLLDWMIYLLTFPSGFNSAYIWYCCQGIEHQKFFKQHTRIPEYIAESISEFKTKREDAINYLINYANESISTM
ncbi:MAG: hypothetical protein JW967_05125 [Dehalococcoidales bacterium]|nr:hypothetical protein [Dehalococcoidales bacterium]